MRTLMEAKKKKIDLQELKVSQLGYVLLKLKRKISEYQKFRYQAVTDILDTAISRVVRRNHDWKDKRMNLQSQSLKNIV